MQNENINELTEQDIIELYDDIVETPMIAAITCPRNLPTRIGSNCCTKGTYTDLRGNLTGGFCQVSY